MSDGPGPGNQKHRSVPLFRIQRFPPLVVIKGKSRCGPDQVEVPGFRYQIRNDLGIQGCVINERERRIRGEGLGQGTRVMIA